MINVDNTIIATLMKLLAIKIVASNFGGSPNKWLTSLLLRDLEFLSSSLSAGFSEKKATSDPETSPEHSNSKAVDVKAKKVLTERG